MLLHYVTFCKVSSLKNKLVCQEQIDTTWDSNNAKAVIP